MAAKDEMRKKIQKSQSNLRKKKLEERKKKDELKVQTRKNPFHRKHGDDAEKKRIDSMAHLSNREKRVKKRNIDAGTTGKSTTKSKSEILEDRLVITTEPSIVECEFDVLIGLRPDFLSIYVYKKSSSQNTFSLELFFLEKLMLITSLAKSFSYWILSLS